MTNENEKSLGDDNTFSGGPRGRDDSPMSLGDQATFGDASSGGDTVFDDGMEIVDLAARYKTEGVLGKGGMGEVLLATDTRLNRKVAIKRIHGDAAKSKTAVNRFLTEAQSIAALNHPNIVQIYDYGRAVDGPFLIMEYVEGSSLLEKCRDGALPLEQAIDLTCQLCDGLGKAHSAGIIHRDIKPANVLLTADGVPKLTDFGLAKAETGDTGQTMAGAVLGTLDFMPPEQRKDAALTDARSDLWSLAATLYQMVTGKSPKIIKFNDVPQSLQDVLGKALEDSKDDRYRVAKEFRDALTGALQKASDVQDLNQGECPSCGVKNEGSRKFCKGCGEKLEAECLSCHAEIPLWEEFCGSCGSQQSVLLDLRKEDHAKEQALAEEQLRIGAFGSAQTIAERLAKESDPRLRTIKAWAKSFLPEVEQQREQQTQAAQQSVAEARQHFAAHDYESTLKALAQIPSGIRLAGVSDLTTRAGAAQEEVTSLADQIRTRVDSRELSGLIKLVDRYLELKPGEERYETLQKTLQARDAKQQKAQQEALKQAQALFAAGNDEAGLTYIEGLGEDQKSPEVREIREQILSRRRTRQEIVSDYQEKHFAGLLERVTWYLSEVPGDEEVESIRKRLSDRDRKLQEQLAQLLTRIEKVELAGEFQKALTLLEKVPDECWTDDFEERRQELSLLTTARAAVLKQLAEAEDQSAIKLALQAVEDYQTGFAEMTSRDETFTTAVNRAKKQLTIFKDQEAAAQRRRRLKIRLYSALALMLVIAAGAGTAWLSHQQKVSDAIADARNRGDAALSASEFTTAIAAFDEVLQLAPQDAAGLLARAEANLRQPAPNLPAAEADLASAIASGAASNDTQPIQWLLICGKTEAFAVAGEIADAEASLRKLSLHGATAELINRAELAIGTALIKRARDAAENFRAEDALADLKQASEFSVAPSEIQQAGQLVASAFAENARGIINLEEFSRALAFLSQARTLDPANTEIARVESEVYTRRAQKSLLNDDRDAASADFLKARQLNPQGTELGRLAAQLAGGLVQRCETAFSDAVYQEATAALATVAAVDPNNTDVADLKTRLGTVLLAEADRAVADKDVDRTAGLAEAIAELNVLPTEQNRLLTAAAGLLFEQGQVQIQQSQILDAANTIVRIHAMLVDETQKTQALEALMSQLEPALTAGLKSPTPQTAANALMVLPDSVLLSAEFSKSLGELPENVRDLLPAQMLRKSPPPAVAPFDEATAKAHQQAWAEHLGIPVETTNSIGMKFAVIPPGEFMMGSPDDEPGRGHEADETLHRVTLTQPFEVGVYEVTQEQYERVMGGNPATLKDQQNPAGQVSWDDAVEFCRELSTLPAEKSSGYVYRLLTEAEWEYTCRAGTTTKYSFGDNEDQLGEYAWYNVNSGITAHSVGGKKPNAWGLCDMHGNGWEWCQDLLGDYPTGAATDPTGPSSGSNRVRRGGSWKSGSGYCRSALRDWSAPGLRNSTIGFRVLRSSVEYEFQPSSQPVVEAPPPTVAPFDAAHAKAHQQAWADYLGVPVNTTNSIGMHFAVIPPGEFSYGKLGVARTVILQEPFEIGVHEVTVQQWVSVMGSNPSSESKEGRFAVDGISWNDAEAFVRKLSELASEESEGYHYRLPTEAEWEYACRAGTQTAYSFGDDAQQLNTYAWFEENRSGSSVHIVGEKPPNPWGLHDMHGNVWEFCNDWLADLPEGVLTDPQGPQSGQHKVRRGGDRLGNSMHCRSDYRIGRLPGIRAPGLGLRIVRTSVQNESQPLGNRINAAGSTIKQFEEGLIAFFPFNGNALDASGNEIDVSANNLKFHADRHGTDTRAGHFDGTASTFIGDLGPLRTFSVAVWIRSVADADRSIIGFFNSNGSRKDSFLSLLHHYKGGHPVDGVRVNYRSTAAENGGVNLYNKHAIHDGSWHHLAVCIGDNNIHLFIDGKVAAAAPSVISQFTKCEVRIGENIDNWYYEGSIDNIRIYDRALSVDEVKSLFEYESQRTGQPVEPTN